MDSQVEKSDSCQYLQTNVQFRASTDGQLLAKLPFGAAPVVGRAYASTATVPQFFLRYWRGTKLVVNFHLGCS